jgi:hypothetical protein
VRVRSAVSAILFLCLLPAAPAVAASRDRDRDRMPDRWERKHRLSKARADADRDGLTNLAEFRSRTNPRRRDSDRDRLRDGDERRFGWHPLKRDSDGDGLLDGQENSGVVTAVDGLRVTITLAAGGRKLNAGLEDPSALSCVTPAEAAAEADAGGSPEDSAGAALDEVEWLPEWGPKPADPDADDNDDADAPLARMAQLPDDPVDDGADAEAEEPEPVAPPQCQARLRVGALVHEADSELGARGRRLTMLRLVT